MFIMKITQYSQPNTRQLTNSRNCEVDWQAKNHKNAEKNDDAFQNLGVESYEPHHAMYTDFVANLIQPLWSMFFSRIFCRSEKDK